MSPKAFRLVDEIKKEPPQAPSEISPRAAALPKSTEKSVHREKPVVEDADAVSEGLHISAITPLDGGEWISLTLEIMGERKQLRLLTEQYATMRPMVGEITREFAEKLMSAGELCDAVRKGMELLGYGPMSCRRLMQKLTVRGFTPEIGQTAAEYLVSHGFLPEGEEAVRFAEQGVRKLWGPRRIREDLYARGFPSEVIEMAMESLEEVDFQDNCARVITKKYGNAPTDTRELKKMIVALMRLGYTYEHIKGAMKEIK